MLIRANRNGPVKSSLVRFLVKRESKGIGLVGPMSNHVAPPQLLADVPYKNMDEMRVFERRWRDERREQWFTMAKLSGFCLLVKRAVYEAIGGLDERRGLGLFDDDDLVERARRAGFELAVAHDLFVHHFGSRTFAGARIDAEKLFSENSQRFAEKWGTPVGNGQAVALKPWVGQDQRKGKRNQPRMNTNLHGWESDTQRRGENGAAGAPIGRQSSLSDRCFIRGPRIFDS